MSKQVVVVVSLLVGVALGAAGMTLAREQAREPHLQIDVSCDPFDPSGPFLGPTGVHVTLRVVFRSAADLPRMPEGQPKIEVTFTLPARWTAYPRGSGETRATGDHDRRVVITFELPAFPPWPDLRTVREGELVYFADVLGPTDAAPERFAVEVSMVDFDGRRVARTVDDPCPLPAGPLHEDGAEE